MDDVEAEEEILTEGAFLDSLAQVLVRRCDDTQIKFDVLQTAQPPERLFLQNAQQFGLQHQRNFADLVEEQRTLIGEFEDAALLRAGVSEGALFVTE